MYLYDYQLTALRKFKRGHNYLLHGPRQSGVTVTLLNYGLHHCSQDNDMFVEYYTRNIDSVGSLVFDAIYAAQTSRVAAFRLSLSSEHDNVFSFNNGSKLHLTTIDSAPPEDRLCDLLLMDDSGTPNRDALDYIIKKSNAAQVVFGLTGGMHIDSGIHSLYLQSLKGLYDMDYLRWDWRIIGSIAAQQDKLLSQVGLARWNADVEYLLKPPT